MGKRKRAARYRNLCKRGSVYYYERVINGKRDRTSLGTGDIDIAATRRDALEEATKTVKPVNADLTFEQTADQYLEVGTADLAATTRTDRHRLLDPGKPVRDFFGPMALCEIGQRHLQAYWDERITKPKRARATGANHLDAVSAVMVFALDRELIESNPVDGFRRTLARRQRTKKARAEADKGSDAHPIEKREDLGALVVAADDYRRAVRTEGKPGKSPRGIRSLKPAEVQSREQAYLAILLMLDAGLRMGEAIGGLHWEDVYFDPAHTEPYIAVRRAVARGGELTTPKSGRAREVQLSARLKAALLDWRAKCGTLGDGPVISLDQQNFRGRLFPRIRDRAKLPTDNGRAHKPKDLRDSFASHLLSAGIPLPYISAQLGHADVAVTSRHYARWIGGGRYIEPPRLKPGQVPSDLLSQRPLPGRRTAEGPTFSPQISPHLEIRSQTGQARRLADD